MLIRNFDSIKIITCYKVNKNVAKYLVDNMIPMFAMDEKNLGEYYFIKNENIDKKIKELPLYLKVIGKYEIVGREVKKVE